MGTRSLSGVVAGGGGYSSGTRGTLRALKRYSNGTRGTLGLLKANSGESYAILSVVERRVRGGVLGGYAAGYSAGTRRGTRRGAETWALFVIEGVSG